MKAVGALFSSIATHANVVSAVWRAARGKRVRGPVQAFLCRLESNVNDLVRELASGEFQFGGYESFAVRDTKSRMIHAPGFRDRVVHHAMMAVLGPVIERGSIAHSYACRHGKGQHLAVQQVRQWARRTGAFLKADVSKYYDSIPHDQLRGALARRFRERRVLDLFDRLLDSYQHRPGYGLPIGALTSQYLGNYYLEPVDHWVQERKAVRRYARYMDDMLVMGEMSELCGLRDEFAGRLAVLGLRISNGGVLNYDALGIPWLGFTVYPDRIRLNAVGRRRLRRRVREVERSRGSEDWCQARVTALFAHATLADDVGWRREVCRFSRFGDTLEADPCDAGRFLEQHCGEVPRGDPQQEASARAEQEPGLSGPAVASRNDGMDLLPDDACSCAPSPSSGEGDKTKGKSPPSADSAALTGATKVAGGAPDSYVPPSS